MADVLTYRFARADEIPAIARLIAHSFPGAARPPEWHEEQLRRPLHGGGSDSVFVGEASGRVVAALQLHPLRQWIAGELLPVAGVGTVSIAPTHRRRGVAAELMNAALRAARERGDVASALYPFRTSFYQKLGYGVAGVVEQYQIAPHMLADAAERTRVELLDAEHTRTEALELYRRWAQQQNGQLERGDRLWTQLTTGADRALFGYRAMSGSLEGYALVTYRADLPRTRRYLEVDELVWTSAVARRALYGWLASLGDQWEQLLIRALPSHHFMDWVSEPRLPLDSAPAWALWAPAATLLMGPMFRLLDVRAWSRRKVARNASLALAVDVTDAQLADNAGSWRLSFDAGQVAVERNATAELHLRLDMSTLSRLYIGALRASAALDAGLLECDRPDAMATLDNALALPEPWMFDRF